MMNMTLYTLDVVFIYRIYDWFLIKHKFAKVIDILRRGSFSFEVFSMQTIKCSKTSYRKLEEKCVSYKDLMDFWANAKVTSRKR